MLFLLISLKEPRHILIIIPLQDSRLRLGQIVQFFPFHQTGMALFLLMLCRMILPLLL